MAFRCIPRLSRWTTRQLSLETASTIALSPVSQRMRSVRCPLTSYIKSWPRIGQKTKWRLSRSARKYWQGASRRQHRMKSWQMTKWRRDSRGLSCSNKDCCRTAQSETESHLMHLCSRSRPSWMQICVILSLCLRTLTRNRSRRNQCSMANSSLSLISLRDSWIHSQHLIRRQAIGVSIRVPTSLTISWETQISLWWLTKALLARKVRCSHQRYAHLLLTSMGLPPFSSNLCLDNQWWPWMWPHLQAITTHSRK